MNDLARERARVLRENARRRVQLDPELYAPWDPAEQLFRHTRRRLAARLLQAVGAFPTAQSRCMELGFGSGGWLHDLVAWGVPPERILGAEIDLRRTAWARRRLPDALLVVGDGGELPLADASVDLMVVSTVLSSVLGREVQQRIAIELARTLRPGGALLWYDFRVDNPRNPHVRGVSSRRLAELFSGLERTIKSVTLAPPIARRTAQWPALAELLESLPFLRSHLLGVFQKRAVGPAHE